MVARSAGKRLVSTLNASLEDGVEWTETEQVTLGLIEAAADRLAVMRGLFDAEAGAEEVSTRRVTELSAEVRQLESNIQKWVASLDPEMSTAKSARHVHAANSRWRRGQTA